MSREIDPDEYRFSKSAAATPYKKPSRQFYQPKKGETFLRGPIPLWWLNSAAKLPGRALHVGIRLWFLAGVTWSPRVKLNQSALKIMGLSRDSARRALAALENAGLVTADRGIGRAPIVTIRYEQSESINGNGNESRMTGENR